MLSNARQNPYIQQVTSLIQYNNLYFLTSTIHNWEPLLQTDQNKKVILDAFSYMTNKKQSKIYAFVILENHFHLLVEAIHPLTISKSRSNKKHQIWKSNSLAVEIQSGKFLKQKLRYIHKNVPRANLNPDSYLYSSWPSYRDGKSKFDFLTLWG